MPQESLNILLLQILWEVLVEENPCLLHDNYFIYGCKCRKEKPFFPSTIYKILRIKALYQIDPPPPLQFFFALNFYSLTDYQKLWYNITVLCSLTHILTLITWRHNWWRHHNWYETYVLSTDVQFFAFHHFQCSICIWKAGNWKIIAAVVTMETSDTTWFRFLVITYFRETLISQSGNQNISRDFNFAILTNHRFLR